jgi:hypothetical protein
MHEVLRGGLLKNRAFVKDDSAASLIAFSEWQDSFAQLEKSQPTHGVILPGDCECENFLPALLQRPLIAIFFEKFNDGRGYSLARILREAGFQGELRAIGDILIDQIFYLHRCGFNSFQLRDDQKQQDALAALESFTVMYQMAADQRLPAYKTNGFK